MNRHTNQHDLNRAGIDRRSGAPAARPARWLAALALALGLMAQTAGAGPASEDPPLYIDQWGQAGTGPGEFGAPLGITTDFNGNVYVADTENHRIQKFAADGTFLMEWGSLGSAPGQFDSPRGITFSIVGGSHLYVVDTWNRRIQKFDTNGTFVTQWGSAGSGDGQFTSPWGIAVSVTGFVYVSDVSLDRIQKFDVNGAFISKWGSFGTGDGQFSNPTGIDVHPTGVYVADWSNNRIQAFDADGNFLLKWGSAGQGAGFFVNPMDVAIDTTNGFRVTVADSGNNRIQKFLFDGTFRSEFGSFGTGETEFNAPRAVTVARNGSGKTYVADTLNNRIQVFGLDEDGDKIPDDWETNGIPIANSTSRYMLPGASATHKDLWVEVDAMTGYTPDQAALDMVTAAFAAAPNSLVDNPDGLDGIALHIQLDETNLASQAWADPWGGFDAAKANHFGTTTEQADADILAAKARAYRYCIFGHSIYGTDSSGLAELPGNDFMVTLGVWPTPGGTVEQQAGTFMHELGHTLGLFHGGDQDDGSAPARFNYKPNYYSVMNYLWQVPYHGNVGISTTLASYRDSWALDYSRAALPGLDEMSLNETNGIGGSGAVWVPVGPPLGNLANQIVAMGGAVDWNRDGDTADTSIATDCNHVYSYETASPDDQLTGHVDWSSLQFGLTGHANFDDGVHVSYDANEITHEILMQIFNPCSADPGSFGAEVFGDDFVCGTLTNWTFDDSTDGVPAGADCPGTWSVDVDTVPLEGEFSPRLFAQAIASCAPWQVNAAMTRTVDPATYLEVTLRFDAIGGATGTGHAFFQIALINADDPSKTYTYIFATDTIAGGDTQFVVSPGEVVDFAADYGQDYFQKYGVFPVGPMILRFRSSADYAESAPPGEQIRTADVTLDQVRVLVEAPCPGDFNGDSSVDVLDLLQLLAAWGPCTSCDEDINGDDAVDVLDLLELLAHWGGCG